MQAEEGSAGKTVKCPGCSAKIKIPEAPGAPAPSSTEPPAPSIPKPNVPSPDSSPAIPPPNLGAGASSAPAPTEAASEPLSEPVEEQTLEHQITDDAPRPIEYFYTGTLGNIAQVSFWLSLAIGLGIAGVVMMAIFLSDSPSTPEQPANYLYQLFIERSWVQFVTTGLAGWTLGILILKMVHIKKQRSAMSLDALPQEISPEINMYNVADFYDHVINLPRKLHDSFMHKRLRKGLEYFYVRESNSEVAGMMSSQSDIDANSIASSYAQAKVFLWAIPIMGFIGTVLGIGGAIGSFAETLANASDPEAMMGGLQTVLGGLGTAFDTTFLALVFSILLMIPASSLQATEEDVLNLVDEYSNDNLIKRLNDGSAGGQFTDSAALKSLGEAISASNKDVVGKFGEIHGNMKEVYDKQTEHYKTVAEAVDKQLSAIEDRAKGYESKLDEDISGSVKNLAEGITNLNNVLKELNGKQVVVKKKMWPFG